MKIQFISIIKQAISSGDMLHSINNIGGIYITREKMESMKEIKPGDDISLKIRAFFFPPYDGAFILINGIKYTLIDQFILEHLDDPLSIKLFKKKSD